MLATERHEPRLEAGVIDIALPTVSWGAVIGGAFVIAATAVILLAIGAGFGLSSVSAWPQAGASATKFAVLTGIWLIVVQWLSSGVGGYVAGRLRPRWTGVHVSEAYFRDTAHGILAWAVATIVTVAFLASAISSIVGGTARNGTQIAAAAGQGAAQSTEQTAGSAAAPGYFVDLLFRQDHPAATANLQDARAETSRILARSLTNGGNLPAADRSYLAELVAAQTGLSQADAQKRVDGVVVQAKAAEQKLRADAEAARKDARDLAFFIGFSMLIGAFIAGVAAKLGGHHLETLVRRERQP